MAYLNNIQSHTLAEFLDSPARPAGTMTLHELRGFLWGLASAPTDIAEEDWFPLVFAGEEPGFRDVQEEDHILLLTLGLWDEQFSRIEAEDSPLAADEYRWHPDPAEAWPLAAWCTGLLKAHYWQEEAWENLLVQTEPVETEDGIFDIAEEIDSTLEIANLFADIDTALAESDDRDLLLASLPDIAGQMPWIMMNYAECGCLLAELLDIGQQEPYRHEQPKTGRNDPCFCGSGKKYKHCCLNAANDA